MGVQTLAGYWIPSDPPCYLHPDSPSAIIPPIDNDSTFIDVMCPVPLFIK